MSSPQSSSPQSYISALTADLDRHAPRIDINPEQVKILNEPTEFFQTLKAKIQGAKKRIYLSTLYIGRFEHELLSTIRTTLQQSSSAFRVSILTDALRGTREAPDSSSASLLASLVAEFPDQVEVRMYHTPNLTGIRKALIPKRINEGWGLQHIKLYGIDDEVILSGANLSNDYFTNRQDRYHIFSSKSVTDYFAKIHNAVGNISFLLQPSNVASGFNLAWLASNGIPNPLDAPIAYTRAATSLLAPLVQPELSQPSPKTNTSLYPLFCHPPSINTELPAITTLLSRRIQSYTFTAGYFNPHPIVASSLLKVSSTPTFASGVILTASPYANGFFGSKGISGMLPAAYSHLSLRFLQAAREKHIQLREWKRGFVGQEGGWTYHSKGIWVTFPGKTVEPVGPSATLIGSSNYTTRSYKLDLEVGAVVVTSDERLMQCWKMEEDMLKKPSKLVDERELASMERKASWKVRIAIWIVKLVGGSL